MQNSFEILIEFGNSKYFKSWDDVWKVSKSIIIIKYFIIPPTRLGPHIHFLYENSQTGSNLCTLDKCTKDQEEIN